MIKRLLLKFAYKINKRYKTVQIVEPTDMIRFKDSYFGIVQFTLTQEIGCVDELKITAHGFM